MKSTIQQSELALRDETSVASEQLAIHPVDTLIDAVASYLEAFPHDKSLTVIAYTSRMPFLQSFTRLIECDPRVVSCFLVHDRQSDDGYVQSDSFGFWGRASSQISLPSRVGETALVDLGPVPFPAYLASRFSQAGMQWSAHENHKRGAVRWFRKSAASYELVKKEGVVGSSRRRLLMLNAIRRRKLDQWSDQTSGGGDDSTWSPTAVPSAPGFARAYLLGAAIRLRMRRIEEQLGSPQPPATTASPIVRFVPDDDAPTVLVSASLEAGGAERQAAITATALHERGMPVRLVGFDAAGQIADHHYGSALIGKGVQVDNAADEATGFTDESAHLAMTESEVLELITLQNRCWSLPLGLGEAVLQYYRYFRRVRPQVVHTWQDYSNTVAGLAALWAGVPRVVLGWRNVSPWHHPLYQPFFRPFYNLILNDPRVSVVSNSKAGAADYCNWLSMRPKHVVITPNAYADVFATSKTSSDPAMEPVEQVSKSTDQLRTVLGVFRFYREKDPLLFARTAAEVHRLLPDLVFKLIGQGALEEALLAEAQRCGLPPDRLVLLGRREDVLSCMAQADLLLHTALYEGLPNVLIEAQAMGLPIVTTDAGGAREAVKPGVTAQVVQQRSSSKLARTVVSCLEDEGWLARARQSGPGFVANRFSMETMLDATLAAYDGQKHTVDGEL